MTLMEMVMVVQLIEKGSSAIRRTIRLLIPTSAKTTMAVMTTPLKTPQNCKNIKNRELS